MRAPREFREEREAAEHPQVSAALSGAAISACPHSRRPGASPAKCSLCHELARVHEGES